MRTTIETTTTFSDDRPDRTVRGPVVNTCTVDGPDQAVAARLIMLAADHLIGRGLTPDDENWFVVQLLADIENRLTRTDDDTDERLAKDAPLWLDPEAGSTALRLCWTCGRSRLRRALT